MLDRRSCSNRDSIGGVVVCVVGDAAVVVAIIVGRSVLLVSINGVAIGGGGVVVVDMYRLTKCCLLYTSDAADE